MSVKKKLKYTVDILTRPWIIGLGLDFGANSFNRGRPCNFFVEITILIWTIGIEIGR